MARITQTKKGSLATGGPQYYLHSLAKHHKEFLRKRKFLPVRLWTPYGMVETELKAVPETVGSVGHDRVQGRPAIAPFILDWNNLKPGDIDYIDFQDFIDEESCFVIRPHKVKYIGKSREIRILSDPFPLTLVKGYHGPLWIKHLDQWLKSEPDFQWVMNQIGGFLLAYQSRPARIHESDLFRISGALDKLGIKLGMHRSTDVDCPDATFQLAGYPEYPCPVEVEKSSSGFRAQHHRKQEHHKRRLVVLCLEHDDPAVRQGYVDVIELKELERLLKEKA